MSALANGARPPFSNDSRPPSAGTGWGGGAHDLGRAVSPRFASRLRTLTISASEHRRSGLPACQYPERMALHVALCRHLDHAEQHSAELVRRLGPARCTGSTSSSAPASPAATPSAASQLHRPLKWPTNRPTSPTPSAARWPTSHSSPPSISPARLPHAGPARPTRRCPMAQMSRCCNACSTSSPRRAASSSSGPTNRACPPRLARTFGDLRDADIDADELAAWALARPAARARPGARLRTLARAARDARLQRPAGRLPGRPRRTAAHLARDARRGAADRHRHLRPDPPAAPADPPGRAGHRGALRRPRAG